MLKLKKHWIVMLKDSNGNEKMADLPSLDRIPFPYVSYRILKEYEE